MSISNILTPNNLSINAGSLRFTDMTATTDPKSLVRIFSGKATTTNSIVVVFTLNTQPNSNYYVDFSACGIASAGTGINNAYIQRILFNIKNVAGVINPATGIKNPDPPNTNLYWGDFISGPGIYNAISGGNAVQFGFNPGTTNTMQHNYRLTIIETLTA